MPRHLIRWLPIVLILLATAPARAGDLTVFAAASLGTVLADIADRWTAETGGTVTLSLAGSSTLARQIGQGAPADLFISANRDWMDHLVATGRIRAGTRRDIAGNHLVLIAPAGDPRPVALDDPGALVARLDEGRQDGGRQDGGRQDGGRLAMALVDAVPAGLYGRAALRSLGLWDGVASRVAQTDNVRAALRLVATGAVPLGIVYATDAGADPRVVVVARFPPDSHPPIRYPAAAVTGGNDPAAARFLDFLTGESARDLFARHGFPGPEG